MVVERALRHARFGGDSLQRDAHEAMPVEDPVRSLHNPLTRTLRFVDHRFRHVYRGVNVATAKSRLRSNVSEKHLDIASTILILRCEARKRRASKDDPAGAGAG